MESVQMGLLIYLAYIIKNRNEFLSLHNTLGFANTAYSIKAIIIEARANKAQIV